MPLRLVRVSRAEPLRRQSQAFFLRGEEKYETDTYAVRFGADALGASSFCTETNGPSQRESCTDHAGTNHLQHHWQFGHSQLDDKLSRREPRSLSRSGKQ